MNGKVAIRRIKMYANMDPDFLFEMCTVKELYGTMSLSIK